MKKSIIIGIVVVLSVLVYWPGREKQVSLQSMKLSLLPQYSEGEDIGQDATTVSEEHENVGGGEAHGEADFYRHITVKPGEGTLRYASGYKFEEYEKARQQVRLKSSQLLDWKERGPGNVGGRTRGLIVDPDDASCNTWFAGGVGGGVWKTTNAGLLWANLTPDLPNLSISCLAMANSDTRVIYAGTGEGFGSGGVRYGDGIFKSNDKGVSWEQLSSTAGNNDFDAVNRIVVDPLDENILVAVTNTSVQRSTNAGVSWQNVFDDDARVQQVILIDDRIDTLFASVNNKGIIKSIDKGQTWDYVLEMHQGRIEMAVSPTHPNVLYALNQNAKLYLSEDFGKTWLETLERDAVNTDFFFAGAGHQGYYDNTLAVLPSSPYQLLVGGIELYGVEMQNDTVLSEFEVASLGVSSFMAFVDHNNAYLGGAANVNVEYYDSARIEIQFGPGKSQMAHRFTVPEGATSGVAVGDYVYQDYIEVPFEVWDVDHNRQLMVSFRDQGGDGVFNLEWHNDDLLQGREYIWINDVDYNDSPDDNIKVDGGHLYRYIFSTWPVLCEGGEWVPESLPDSKIIISTRYWDEKVIGVLKMTDWRNSTYRTRVIPTMTINEPYLHADNHNIQFCQKEDDTYRIMVANDGGVSYSDDMGASWNTTGNGYNTTQFYGVEKKKGENRYMGGMQDNGTWISLGDPGPLSSWLEAGLGDGFDPVWHPFTGEVINTWQNNSMVRFPEDMQSYKTLTPPDVGTNASFITQVGYHPLAPNNLYMVGVSGVSWTKDFGDSWQVASMVDSLWAWSRYGFVEPSIAQPDIVWAVSRMDSVGTAMLSVDGGLTFEAAGATAEAVNRPSGLATHPSNEKSAFVLFSYPGEPKVLRTNDYGKTWADISGFENGESQNGFPDVAVYSLLVMPHDTSTIWVGTEIGLFVSEDNGEKWLYADNGLPAVCIREMKIRDKQVVLATFGRGVWSLDVPEIPDRMALPYFMDVNMDLANSISFNYVQSEVYDSLFFCFDSEKVLELPIVADTSVLQSGRFDVDLQWGTYSLKLMAYKDGEALESAFYPLEVVYNAPKYSYSNSFDVISHDFYCENMAIEDSGDLEVGMALHSVHPYSENQMVKAALMTPIILSKGADGNGTKLRYSDIPMVEAGVDGVSFGQADFNDFVMPLASKDGEDWTPLMYGYDFNSIRDQAFSLGMSVDSKPTNALFSEKEVDLLSFFEEGDTILIAFYLFSNEQTTGWGWVIDDMFIGLDVPSVLAEEPEAGKVRLYPVPCSHVLHVAYEEMSPENYVVYDFNGRIMLQGDVSCDEVVELNTQGLKSATYVLELKGQGGVVRSPFVVVH